MNLEQFQLFLDSHGADPARWPARERERAVQLIARNADARALFEAAGRLDAALTRHMAETSDTDAAAMRVLARLSAPLPRQKKSFWRLPAELLDWQFAPAWPRVAALACCAIIGFGIGLAGHDRFDARFGLVNRDVGAFVFEPEPASEVWP